MPFPRDPSLLDVPRSPDRHVCWISSLLVHATALAVLSLFAIRTTTDAVPAAIDTRLAGNDQVPIETVLQKLVSTDEASSGGALTASAFLDVPAQSETDATPNTHLAQNLELSPFEDLAAGSLTAHVGDFVPGGGGIQAGTPGAGSTGTGKGTGFFGSKISGKRVVFVVDASRSMNMQHPGPARTRFKRVQLELLQAIAQLTPEQQFFVIFFNSRPWPMPADQPVNATPQAQHFYLRWVAAAEAGGRTVPGPALALALQKQPDVVYFLTDGRFDYRVVPLTTEMNRGQAVIHTIGFADSSGELMLTEIATQNGGRYRFIPPDEAFDEPADPATEQVDRTASTGAVTVEPNVAPAAQ